MTTHRLLAALVAAGMALSTARAGVQHAPADDRSIAPPASAVAAGQVWLVSTRSLPHPAARSSRRRLPEVNLYHDGWQSARYDDLLNHGRRAPTTVVFVHGNDTDDVKCRSRGLTLFQELTAEAPKPLRLIVWSWPADYVPGTIRHDAQLKAERAEDDAIYLARFLTDLNRDQPVLLVGYSLGARVAGGALQLLSGGVLEGQSVGMVGRPHPPLHGMLIAAAVNDDWLLPGHRYGRALSAVDRMLVFVNPHDRVLRWYRFLTPAGGAALGLHGVASPGQMGPQGRKLLQIDVGPLLKAQHGWSYYAASPRIIERLRHEAFDHMRPASLTAKHTPRR